VMIDRRSLLKSAGLAPLIGAAPRLARAAGDVAGAMADYTLRIGAGLVELAPDHVVSTTLYNGQFPDRCCGSRRAAGRRGYLQ